MAILVIDTQFMENYGAHDWDGTAECPQYWKYKGGSSYKVAVEFDKDYEWAEVYVDRILEELQPKVEHDDDYSREYILGWHLEDDDWLSEYERSQLEWDGKILYPEPTLALAA